jgi:hypothetical protein
VEVRDRRRRGEVAPAEFYCSLEEGVPERVAPAVFGFPQRREFPGEQTVCGVCYGSIRNTHSTSGNLFFCSDGILLMQNTLWVFCSAGNPTRRGNPGQKRTRTDAILKKI